MLQDALQHELNERLCGLLKKLRSKSPYGELAAEARRIIETYEHEPGYRIWQFGVKLVPPGWKQSWLASEYLPYALFGDIEKDRDARALHDVFTELIRFTLDATTPHRKRKYTERVENELCDYLSLRGYEVEARSPRG